MDYGMVFATRERAIYIHDGRLIQRLAFARRLCSEGLVFKNGQP